MSKRDRLNTFIGIKRLSIDLENHVKDDLKNLDLNLNEFAVLEILYSKGKKTTQEIREKILIANSSTTYVIDKLCDKGLVVRENGNKDRRFIYVELTSKGKEFMDGYFPKHEELILRYFENLQDDEIITFLNTIKKLTKYEHKE